MYEVIWHLLLTVCLQDVCRSQEIQWFANEPECNVSKAIYEEIPQDGPWTLIEYVCKPRNSIAT